MKAIQKTKSKKLLSERVTAMEGDPRGALATWGRRMAGRTRSIFIVLRHGILSLYSYIRKFVPWRSRTYIQNLRHVRIAGITSSFLFGLLALAIIIPLYNVSGTEDTEAATGTAIDSSITFTSTRATATVDLTPTSASGTFASSTSGTTDAAFSITTTNSQGYELKIKSTSGTVLKPTTTTSDSDGLSTISTSGITSSSFTNNTWGYLPNYYNCNEASGACTTNTTSYYPATTSDVTLRKTTSANNTAHNYTIGLGAKADLTKTSGTYTLGGNKGSLVLTYVANPTAYSISYDKGNATGTPSNIPTTQSSSVSATSVTLSSAVPTLTGYTFTGWCLGEVNRSSAEVDSCTGTGAKTFAAGGTFGIDRTSTNVVTLHAMWSKATVDVTVNFAGSGVTGVTFANTTYGNVSVSTSGNTAALKYGVQYDITGSYSSGYEFSSWAATAGSLGSTSSASTTYSTTSAATLTLNAKQSCIAISGTMQAFSPTSNSCTSGTLTDSRGGTTKSYTVAKLADGKWWMTSNLDLPGGTKLTSSDSNVFSDYDLPASSSSPDFSSNTAATVYNSGSTNCSASKGCYSYYSYVAATAGTGSSVSTVGYNASGSICPKGWRLPTATTSNADARSDNNWKTGDFYALATAYGANLESNFYQYSGTFYNNAGPGTTPNFLLSGGFFGTSFYYAGSYGYYWSSTAYDSSVAYALYFGSGNVNSADRNDRKNGLAVRCFFVPTMQDATVSSLAALMPNTGDTTILRDSRDDKEYSVAKLADGKYWMTSNLDLAGGTKLTNADSDVSSDYNLPSSSPNLNSDYDAKVYNSGSTDCSASKGCYSYYSYLAATAGTGSSVSTNGYNASGSICPKGWRLPTATTSNASPESNNNWKTGDSYALATAYGANLESRYYDVSSSTGGKFYTKAGPGKTPNFLLTGYFNGTSFFDGGSRGYYWLSSSGYVSSQAYALSFDSGRVYSANENYRRNGYAVRCVYAG